MRNFNSVLIVTHVIYRKSFPFDKIEGPYSHVQKALSEMIDDVRVCQLPLNDFNNPVTSGRIPQTRDWKIPVIFGTLAPLKYFLDLVIIFGTALKFLLSNKKNNKLIIGIDPLSCLPLAVLRKIFKFKLIFHSVDFNRHRSDSKLMQKAYEFADRFSSKNSDQIWVVSESLLDYKKDKLGVTSYYLPNTTRFNERLFEDNKDFKTGRKIAWSGGLASERQLEIFFRVLKEIQMIKPEMEFCLAPTNNHDKLREYLEKFAIKNGTVLNLKSRAQWQEYAARCDIGIATYDDQDGSTEFIEPTKIWDYLLCGLPFIISREPSICAPIRESGVMYRLDYRNIVPQDGSLEKFLEKDNIEKLRPLCVALAKEFDIAEQVRKKLETL